MVLNVWHVLIALRQTEVTSCTLKAVKLLWAEDGKAL